MLDANHTTTVLKAISDPVRWEIVRQMTEVDELACQTLEERLPVSKPTISYHIRILAQAGLVSIRKEGRYFFYALQRQTLRDLVDELWVLAPQPDREPSQRPTAAAAEPSDAVLLTW
jgi:DNA-binding transcriptional ArsR family regulator